MKPLWIVIAIDTALVALLAAASARRVRARWVSTALSCQAILLWCAAMAAPFVWMLFLSMKSPSEARSPDSGLLPRALREGDLAGLWRQTRGNYIDAWNAPGEGLTFTRYFAVSLGTGVAATAGALATSILAAYAFAWMPFVGRRVLFWLMVATMMVPFQALLIPDYLILAQLGWLDTYAALVVPWTASVFSIFLLRQFFAQIPEDLWHAARIDGAGRMRFLLHVVLPLSKPALTTAGLFCFLGNWNSLMWPLIVTTSPRMRTLMVGLQTFNDAAGTNFHLLAAASTLAIAPTAVLFFLFQRFFTEDLARSGMTG
ncbi:MAG: carbohydrate ABC transporter permease [Candidatus Sumerlaeota bacterium]|nr:carbohydrate ABC transporter permease [Candidatus Sumerlaeota bacterium]